jgi:Uncharacterised protein family (UPF0236)
MAIRASMHVVGGVLLEKLLDGDGGYRGPRIDCGQGHQATFVDYRSKNILTVLSQAKIRRAYYHCAGCQQGQVPKDRELDIVATSFSPGVRRLMGRVGSKEPFDEARADLEALAGIVVNTKQVERISEQLGEQVESVARRERRTVLSGKIVLPGPVPKMYVAVDGTGVPMVPRETQGRPGKDESGLAKTREGKLGCVFTQTALDEDGYPVRDPGSTTYVGAIEAAQQFGERIFTEAIRRGLRQAVMHIVLGDGAPWIWNLAAEHFPGATEIVDLYHAREHLQDLAKILYLPLQAKPWAEQRIEQLDTGDIEGLVASLRRLRPSGKTRKDELRKTVAFLLTNAHRMRYKSFRDQGLFVGSGVIEAGCKTIIGHRLKQSGMRWTVRGANAIIALRCCQLSGRWEQFWEARSAA